MTFNCAICKVAPATDWDHDKETDIIRGPLCHNCNCGIGYLKHDTEVMQQAILYLEREPLVGNSTYSEFNRMRYRRRYTPAAAKNRPQAIKTRRERYQTDPVYRERVKEWNRASIARCAARKGP